MKYNQDNPHEWRRETCGSRSDTPTMCRACNGGARCAGVIVGRSQTVSPQGSDPTTGARAPSLFHHPPTTMGTVKFNITPHKEYVEVEAIT